MLFQNIEGLIMFKMVNFKFSCVIFCCLATKERSYLIDELITTVLVEHIMHFIPIIIFIEFARCRFSLVVAMSVCVSVCLTQID